MHTLIDSSLFGYNEKQSFGRVDFDPNAEDPTVTYTIISIDSEKFHQIEVKLSDLQL